MKFGLIGPSYTLDSISAEAQKVMNWYPEIIESGAGRGPMRLCPTPGIKKFAFTTKVSEGPDSPKVAVDDASVGVLPWVDPTEAEVSDNVYATVSAGEMVAGPQNAAAAVDDASSGTVPWLNPIDAEVSDDVWASAHVHSGGMANRSHYLDLSNFGFGIPPGMTIFGIAVDVEGHFTSTGGGGGIVIVRLIKGGVIQAPSEKLDGFGSYGPADVVIRYGGPSDLWNTGWLPADINDVLSGVAFQVLAVGPMGSTITFFVDAITITVWYGIGLGDSSHYLKLTGFGFAIPAGATIFGIMAAVEGKYGPAGSAGILYVNLVKGGVIQAAGEKSDSFGSYGVADTIVPYGDLADLWSNTWLETDINDVGFGVAFRALISGPPGALITFSVDLITLTVWYGSGLGGTSSRGLHTINDRVFAVVGPNFYELDSAGLVTLRGVVADDGETVSIAGGPTQLLIVSAGVAYSYDLTTDVLAPIVGMLGIPIIAGYSDGYFMVILQDSQRFQISGLLDATTWDPLDVAQISVFPDNLVSFLVDHREAWFWGKKASQVYHDTGNPDFPWEPIDGAYIEAGCAAQRSPVRLDNSVFWVGEDERGAAVAWRASGYTPTRVSNHAVEQAWQSYPTITDAVGYAYQADGHSFWVLSFPTAKATWVYDASTGMWHERGTWDPNIPGYVAHRSQCHAYAWGKHLVGDRLAPNIYEMEKWTVPGPTVELQVIVRWSNDFGHTWGNQHVVSAGRIGEYNTRIHLDQLGRARGRVFEISVIDLVITDDGMPIRRLRRTPIICNEWNWIYFRKLLLDMEVGSGKCDLIEGYVEVDGGKIG